MKKTKILFIVLFSLLIAISSGNAYTVYFTADHSSLDAINGFDFDVVGATTGDLSLTIYHPSDSILSLSGAVPDQLSPTYPWDIATTPTGVTAYDYSFGIDPLTPGVILSLAGSSSFTLDNFVLANNDDPNGAFPYPYTIDASDITDGKVYNVASVPIPGALWLLGSGLIGMVGVRRKVGKS